MPYTYYHQQDGRSLVIISEEKVPEKRYEEGFYNTAVNSWLSKSKSYEVYLGDEEKFKNYIVGVPGTLDKCDYSGSDYILLPNEVVKIDRPSERDRNLSLLITGDTNRFLKQYAFFNQPEEKDLWPSDSEKQRLIRLVEFVRNSSVGYGSVNLVNQFIENEKTEV